MPVTHESAIDRETRLNAFVNAPDPVATPEPTPATPAAPVPATAPTTPAGASGTPEATPVTADPATAPAASTAAGGPSDWIVAKRGDEEFRIPADAVLEFKRRDETLTRTMDEFRRDGMMGTDYQLRKAQFETERQQVQREREQEAVARARLAERQAFLDEQERALREAQTDPQKFEQWQGHMEQLRSNPQYRQAFEASLAKRETDAENRVLRERAETDYVTRAAATVEGWIDALKGKYPGVPVESVQRDFAAQVTLYEQRMGRLGQLGEGPLTPNALEQVFQQHAGVYQQAVAPVTARMKALEDELAALKANAQTDHAVARAKTPSTAPVRGTTATTDSPKAPRYESEADRAERLQRFLRDA